MDNSRFDDLARALSLGGTRRRALGGLLGAAAALLGRLPAEETAAHNKRKRCKTIDDRAKRKRCLKKARKHKRKHARCGRRCPINERCVGGRCACPDGAGGARVCEQGHTCTGNFGCCCVHNAGFFLDPANCSPLTTCPTGSTPCVGTTNTCAGSPSRVCCPRGTTCTAEGTCLR